MNLLCRCTKRVHGKGLDIGVYQLKLDKTDEGNDRVLHGTYY